MLTLARLKEVLYYHPESGDFVWGVKRGRAAVGTQAGTIDGKGYLQICIDCRFYRAHRLAWFYMTGILPVEEVDHIDVDRLANEWLNLRLATPTQNQRNKGAYRNNTTGFKGIQIDKRSGKWRPKLNFEGKDKYLGLWDNLEDAIAAYAQGLITFHRDFARAA